jgi:uncharacterized protein (TIGR03435 family)
MLGNSLRVYHVGPTQHNLHPMVASGDQRYFEISGLAQGQYTLEFHGENGQIRGTSDINLSADQVLDNSPLAAGTKVKGAGPPGNWKATGVTMKVLANELSSLPEIGGMIVIDRTGRKGSFDFAIRWTPDPTMGAAPPGADDGPKSDPSAPSLLTALQEQLGLKLESTKEQVDVIVIDSAELPTPN